MSQPWMPFYVGDYLADTGHLGALEHASYLLLIFHYWRTGGIPNDDQQLARISKLTAGQWEKVKPTVLSFFDHDLRHKRIDDELKKAEQISNARRESGSKGGHAKSLKRRNQHVANATDLPEQNATQSQSHIHTSSLRSDVGAKRAHRLPEDWVLPEQFRQAARERGLPDAEIDRQASRMLNWSRSAKAGSKLDWFRTWLNWIDDVPRQQRGPPPSSNRNGLAAIARELYGTVDGTTLETNRPAPALRLLPLDCASGSGPDGADAWGLPRKAGDGFG